MKENYENISKTRLTRRMPVIIRIDGKAFHTFTRGFEKPFDYILMSTMKDTTLELCKNIQNAKLGYCQSDEISILLCDYDNFVKILERFANNSLSYKSFQSLIFI